MTPILLYDGECQVCRTIAHWVEKAAISPSGAPGIVVRAIGQDPAAIRRLNPNLDIWEAYAAPHVLLADGSMKRAGYAVTEVFRCLPGTKWIADILAITVFGTHPFQAVVNAAYVVLADIRPLLGCSSCGRPSGWVRPLLWIVNQVKRLFGGGHTVAAAPHFTSLDHRRKSG